MLYLNYIVTTSLDILYEELIGKIEAQLECKVVCILVLKKQTVGEIAVKVYVLPKNKNIYYDENIHTVDKKVVGFVQDICNYPSRLKRQNFNALYELTAEHKYWLDDEWATLFNGHWCFYDTKKCYDNICSSIERGLAFLARTDASQMIRNTRIQQLMKSLDALEFLMAEKHFPYATQLSFGNKYRTEKLVCNYLGVERDELINTLSEKYISLKDDTVFANAEVLTEFLDDFERTFECKLDEVVETL